MTVRAAGEPGENIRPAGEVHARRGADPPAGHGAGRRRARRRRVGRGGIRDRGVAGRGSGCCPPATSCATPASRSVPGRSTTRTPRCCRRSPHVAARSQAPPAGSPMTARPPRRGWPMALERVRRRDRLRRRLGRAARPRQARAGGASASSEMFWGVALQPGKPTWFGTRERKLVFGLPGNPVSAAVTFSLFAAPGARGSSGRRCRAPAGDERCSARPCRANPRREQALRVRLERRDGDAGGDPQRTAGFARDHLAGRRRRARPDPRRRARGSRRAPW